MRRSLAIVCLIFFGAGLAAAQDQEKNEVSLSVGRTFVSDQTVPNAGTTKNTVHSGKGLSFNFSYARVLRRYRWGSLSVEVPVLYNPDEDINYALNQVPVQYSSIFVTPAARVRFLEGLAFEPWVSLGGGVGRFTASKQLVFSGTNTGHRIKTTGALDGAVGFDVPLPAKRFSWLLFRFEARDNWSSEAPINVVTANTRQHNYYVGGGLVARF